MTIDTPFEDEKESLMKRWILVLAMPLLALGCADRQPLPEEAGYEAAIAPIPSYSEYKLAWQSLYNVMSRHFLIRVSRYEDGYIVATSQITAPQGMKQRLKVVGQIVEDEDGFFEPQIHVLEQYDMSVSSAFAEAVYQPKYEWRTAGRNHDAEADLVEEVEIEMRGGRLNPQSGQDFRVAHPGSEAPPPGPEGHHHDPQMPQNY